MSSIEMELLWAEKYRPKSLNDMVNQVEIVRRLKQFVKDRNMPHLLFAGPPGTGKTTAAHALAHDFYGPDYRMYMLELNASVTKDTPIMVKINGNIAIIPFEKLDKMYFTNGDILKFGDGEYVKVNDLKALSIDKRTGKIKWFDVSWIIRHKARYVIKVTFEEGGEIKLTGNHSIIVVNEDGDLVKRKASEIRPGDYLISFITELQENGVMNHSININKTLNGDIEIITANYPASKDSKGFVSKVPNVIYSLRNEDRVSFLKNVSKKDYGVISKVYSEFENLLIDVTWLARISGINSFIHNDNVKLVWEKENGKLSPLPALPFIKFFSKADKAINTNWESILKHELNNGKELISKKKLVEIFKFIDLNSLNEKGYEYYKKLLFLLNSDIHVVKVKEVKIIDYNDYVYDVSIPNNNLFFAGKIPILLHNSDERGIDVIRSKVKEFARSKLPAEIPFKIVLLDEADNMTADAQQALRRLMEMYVTVTRFILIANYPSKIIEPIQSRCAVFRFTPLKKEDIIARLKWIAEKEKVTYEDEALDVIYDLSEGDLRKAINLLQSSAALGRVTISAVYKVVGLAHPREIREMLKLAFGGKFIEARNKLRQLMINYGLSGLDVVKQLHKEVFSTDLKLPEELRVLIADYLGEIQFRLVEGADDEIQLNALLARLALLGKKFSLSSKIK